MEHLLNKVCLITVKTRERLLYYIAEVIAFDDTHFYFVDKFGKEYGFRRSDLILIKDVRDISK
jgi:hypothetical protein